MRARLSYALGAALAVVLVAVSGCAAPSTSESATPTQARADASQPGTYTAGDDLTFANGMVLTVPEGWLLILKTPGAAVDRHPEETGVTGAVMVSTLGGSGVVSVCGPQAGYGEQLATAEDAYKGVHPNGVTIARVQVESSMTAFVNSWDTGRREVVIFIEHEDAFPASIAVELDGETTRFRSTPAEKLPAALIDYFRLRSGSG